MVEDFLRQSPLAHLALETMTDQERQADHGIAMRECPFAIRINLRGRPEDGKFRANVERSLGVSLPEASNRASGTPFQRAILWLGPDEWLITISEDEGAAPISHLRKALDGMPVAVTDVSENYTVIEVSGPRARDVLLKGCSIDLHPRSFAVGHCAQTLISKAPVLLHQIDDTPSFHVYVRRSFADYTWRWLADAAGEWGVTFLRT